MNRRKFIRSLSRTALVLPFADIIALAARQQQNGPDQRQHIGPHDREYDAIAAPPPPGPTSPIEGTPLGVTFTDVVKESGLDLVTTYGGIGKNKYLLETTGCGLAFYDYDNDGWVDLFIVNGWRLQGFPDGNAPHSHLFKNNRDGTFTDVTAGSGLEHKTGWGQACCVGDYDNDGHDDLFVTYYGQNALYRNHGDGTFTNVTEQAGLMQSGPKVRWNTGCTFVDYDRDGHLDLFVANYVDLDLKSAPTPQDGPCTYKGLLVACGPPGLPGGKNILYHNNGNGTFAWTANSARHASSAISIRWKSLLPDFSLKPTFGPESPRSSIFRSTAIPRVITDPLVTTAPWPELKRNLRPLLRTYVKELRSEMADSFDSLKAGQMELRRLIDINRRSAAAYEDEIELQLGSVYPLLNAKTQQLLQQAEYQYRLLQPGSDFFLGPVIMLANAYENELLIRVIWPYLTRLLGQGTQTYDGGSQKTFLIFGGQIQSRNLILGSMDWH